MSIPKRTKQNIPRRGKQRESRRKDWRMNNLNEKIKGNNNILP